MEIVGKLILGIALCALVALLGKNRKIGYGLSFIACFFLSPLIGIIIILCSKKKNAEYINNKDDTNNNIVNNG